MSSYRKLWTACQGRSPLWERFAQQLGDLLLAPFDDAIAAAEHVILVPHRWGHLAPLQALHWRGAPLIEAKTVSVLPSASALRFLPRGAPPRGGPLLAVGDPTNMSRRRPGEATATGGFGALPWSGAQAAEAAGWFPGSPAPLLGARRASRPCATGSRARARGPLRHPRDPRRRAAARLACVLAEGDTLDVLGAARAPARRRPRRLSTCDSAGTPVTPGDEVVGLAWLTLAAGARAVVASLWKVAELSTALLMRAFYGALRDGPTAARGARAAQRHVKGLTRRHRRARDRGPARRRRRRAAAPTRAIPATCRPTSHTRFTGRASCCSAAEARAAGASVSPSSTSAARRPGSAAA